MQEVQPSIAVAGAGAIGGIVAALLSKKGYDVELVCKYQETLDSIATHGVRLAGKRGDITIPVNGVRDISDLKGPKDIVFLATKATDCFEAAAALLPMLQDHSVVVSLQNGLCEPRLADTLGLHRTMGCVVEWSATMHGPGNYEMTADGEFIIGRIDGVNDHRLPALKTIMDGIVPTRTSTNMMGELFSKLIINACINSLGVITGHSPGRLVLSSTARALFIRIITEAMSIADAMNLQVAPRGGGRLNYYTFVSGRSILSLLKRHIMVLGIGFKTRNIIPSSIQSVQRGKPTETRFFNGYLSETGTSLAIPTPVNDSIGEMIAAIEAGNLSMSPDNLDWFDL